MVLPVTNLRVSQINTELGRSSTATYRFDDFEGRVTASCGTTQSNTLGTPVYASNFQGHARRKISINARTQNYDVYYNTSGGSGFTPPNESIYAIGKTYTTLTNNSVVGSTTPTSPSMIVVGYIENVRWGFATGDIVEIINSAGSYIVGAGGAGGICEVGNATAGQAGGIALQAERSTLLLNYGIIGAGGGGGGAGNNSFFFGTLFVGGGGGGGAGYNAFTTDYIGGAGGRGGGASGGGPGSNGSLTTGGAGGPGNVASGGGRGGDLGQAGGSSNTGGGAVGKAINGLSNIWLNPLSTGQLIGPTVG